MKNIVTVALATLGIMAVAIIVAFFGGTVLWLIWPVAIPAAFPGLVASGAIAAKLAWWQSVCLVWVCGLLIKSSQSNTNKKGE
jgi:hypothetical protein